MNIKIDRKLSVILLVIIVGSVLLIIFWKSGINIGATVGETIGLTLVKVDLDSPKGQILYQPRTIRIDANGNLLVLDAGNNRLVEFSKEGRFLKEIGGIGQGPGDLFGPMDFDIDREGRILILERTNRRVSIFEADGTFDSHFPIDERDPISICATPKSTILINSPRVDGPLLYVFDYSGKRIGSVGSVESFEVSPFPGTHALATELLNQVIVRCNSRNEIIVAYYGRPLVRIFDTEGHLLLEKTIESPEISDVRETIKIQSDSRKPRRNWFSTLHFFTDLNVVGEDMILLKANRFMMDNGNVKSDTLNYLLMLNEAGNKVKTYFVSKRLEEPSGAFGIYKFAYDGDAIVATDFTNGTLAQFPLDISIFTPDKRERR